MDSAPVVKEIALLPAGSETENGFKSWKQSEAKTKFSYPSLCQGRLAGWDESVNEEDKENRILNT